MAFSSSSSYSADYRAHYARLISPYYFCTATPASLNDWLKIDLQQITHVTKWKYQQYSVNYYETFRIDVSLDDVNYEPVKYKNGDVMVINGSLAKDNAVATQDFAYPILARYLKIVGLSFPSSPVRVCMQFEIFGCTAPCTGKN